MTKAEQGCDVKPTLVASQQPAISKPGLDAWRRYRAVRAAEARLRRRSLNQSLPYAQNALLEQKEMVLQQRNQLVEANLPVLVHVAERMRMKLPSFVEQDELVQAGVPALIRAVEHFRPSLGFKFETFAVPRLKGAILDALRSSDDVPRLARQRNRILTEADESFRKSKGRL